MTTKNNIFQDLKEVLKDNPSAPKQKVVPVKESALKGEKQLTVYVDKEKLKKLKVLSAQLDLTLKEMFNEAITEYWLKKPKNGNRTKMTLDEVIENE